MAALVFNTLEFYSYIAYSVKENDRSIKRIHVRVGDVIEVSEEQEEEAYAQVKAIILHKYNDKKFYSFLYLIGFLLQILTTTFCNVPCIHYKVKLINISDTYIHLTLLIIFSLLTLQKSGKNQRCHYDAIMAS